MPLESGAGAKREDGSGAGAKREDGSGGEWGDNT
jgi:hypothetical protein